MEGTAVQSELRALLKMIDDQCVIILLMAQVLVALGFDLSDFAP